ncbi:MAG: type II toxin-antitoxin system Phd/YefM family antitoxin [Peptococcaceae bacterium]|nr:type II toxin-antitoxin system Phd/YefM family antitoxin [Peptococcaceae bacterium]
MNFYTVRDLRTIPKNIWDSLSQDGEVVITNNGKPTALMLDISNGNFEEILFAIKQAQAMIAVNNMRQKAAAAGFMSDDDINREIEAAREEMRGC